MEINDKYHTADKAFFARRTKFSEKYKIDFTMVDHHPLFTGKFNLARTFFMYELLKEYKNVPGDIAEFGVFRGTNTILMAKILDQISPLINRQIYAFDSFEGLKPDESKDGKIAYESFTNSYVGNYELFLDVIALNQLEDVVVPIKGLIEDTLKPLLNDSPALKFSLIFLDTDLYHPTLEILNNCVDRLVPGGALIFDEWNYRRYPGETAALDKFLSDNPSLAFKYIQPTSVRNPTLILRKS